MAAVMNFIKKGGLALYVSLGIFAVTLVGFILFLLSYTTSYYTFGEMNSTMMLVFFIIALAAEIAVIALSGIMGFRVWMRALFVVIIVMLGLAAMYLLGDRFEGIGYTIVTDYDAGHGGEEACWYSIISCIFDVVAIVACVVLGFFRLQKKNV